MILISMLLRGGLNALALMLLPSLMDSVAVDGFVPALITGMVIGVFNGLIRPLLFLLTLPVTVLSLGFFALVINALLFWAATSLVPGISVSGFWSAFWAALIYSVLSSLVDAAVGGKPSSVRFQRLPREN
ncbi:phage holin family protein [Viridibacterium curvum]|uniref:Phage holin family protein n=1 Tax=Viridibacterium curvum TaxID=1101404 RepID=A0ABP9QCI9_9RHOO